ncbi:hypothetical protein AAX26_00563 [Aliarcobacter thereius]|uniref:Beta-lactamase n=1 Tax=Aliarcobacter thereius TaxID=544718 RepID=A0A1C0B8T9_9BACT|nr:sel1 repeat family protein [Aliarcobacter thereius]OCL87478.1 hypothetical protein AAX26_00563 [Aliarcobacter thereius]OCL99977.1 hypothetical protein AAX29_01030 [Aliarcobacter thereius]TLT08758.1 sel1 repeat family protein [Aliarcobacter thereius]HJE02267.1 sel1 repeat family protein [Aliarcobacter thereius]
MSQFIKYSIIILISFAFTACFSKYKNSEVLQSELQIADSCINKKIKLEMDCYDLIAYKNSFAQLRLGIYELKIGNSTIAKDRFLLAKESGNIYANVFLSSMYENGIFYKKDEEMAIKLLKDVEKLDPIAAYKISFYYLANDEVEKAIKLLEFSANKGVKDAQKELVILYSNGQYIKEDSEKSNYFDSLYQDKKKDFSKKIYAK